MVRTPDAGGLLPLFDQDLESPTGHVNNGQDLNAFRTVNDTYGGRPAGFQYAQTLTVETLNITGSQRGDGGMAAGSTNGNVTLQIDLLDGGARPSRHLRIRPPP